MFSTVLSATLQGLQVEFIDVEADLSNGLPMFHMVGYLSSEVKEAGERVRTAIRNSGLVLPAKKIVVNLSPADVRKRGTAFDLPIAVAILASLGLVGQERLAKTVFVGELSLDGRVRSVPGILPIALEAKKHGFQACVVSKENESEGRLVEGIEVIGVENLKATCDVLNGWGVTDQMEITTVKYPKDHTYELDYQDIKGQKLAKRAAEVAVAGNHNMLMIGPPGAGKTMIAKRIPTILPPLTKEESMELTKLYSIVGGLNANRPLILERPFREVHHTATKSALIGGGLIPRPGEISLADKGVLFLDEIAEFQKPVLEMLRQPLEEHFIKIIHIADTDGAFTKNCIKQAEVEKIQYYEGHMEYSNVDEVEKRNEHKSEIMFKLYTTGKVHNIQYRLYFNSCNLEHVLYGELKDFSDDEKEVLSDEFAEKYEGKVYEFIDFISDKSVAVDGTYRETWKYIEKDKNSLQRHSNMHLIFKTV